METYLLSPSILDESFLWFLDVKPIRALVLHMTKTSLGHYQMFHYIEWSPDLKLEQIYWINHTLKYQALAAMIFCKMFVFLNTWLSKDILTFLLHCRRSALFLFRRFFITTSTSVSLPPSILKSKSIKVSTH